MQSYLTWEINKFPKIKTTTKQDRFFQVWLSVLEYLSNSAAAFNLISLVQLEPVKRQKYSWSF